ncbi:MAG TPA: porin [Tepidisphaeraceae bacterium]|jgi:outer membrane murein-binding lipoprotein Lpp|nr:porin [Tepidisphaeraceae bacterium]
MDSASRRYIKAAIAGVVFIGAGGAVAAEPSVEELKAQVQELNSKVSALEARQQNPSDVSATIESVLRDADRRSKLLATSGETSAGYDHGAFFIKSGAFEMKPGAQFQFRNVTNFREDTSGAKADEIENGFEVRRMKFYIEGTAFSPALGYLFQWATDRKSGNLVLEDAFVRYMFNEQVGVRAGQFKDPVHHEELNSSKTQLAVDRTLLNELLGGGITDRVQGVSFIYGGQQKSNPLSVEVALHDGINSDNTNFQKGALDFGIGGRAEYKAMGEWKDYKDFSAKDTKTNLLVIGLGGDWSQAGDGNIYFGTVDAQYEMSNLGVYGAILLVNRDENFTGTDSSTEWGLMVQAGYMLNPSLEIFGRYDVVIFDDEITLSGGDTEDTFHEITVGVNYFLGDNGAWGHKAKITADLSFLPNGSPSKEDGIGILDENNGGTEILLRTQFQLVL